MQNLWQFQRQTSVQLPSNLSYKVIVNGISEAQKLISKALSVYRLWNPCVDTLKCRNYNALIVTNYVSLITFIITRDLV